MTEPTREGPDSQDFALDGMVALVTGGGAVDDGIGNGRAAAITFARAGARVCVADRDFDRAARTVAMIQADGGDAAAFAADLTQEAHARDLIDAVIARYGRLDALDNNIGIGSRLNVVDESLAGWQTIMQVNVATMFLTSKYVAPGPVFTPMVAAGGMSDAARAQRIKASLLQREGTGWDIGRAVVFLCSGWARYITGQVLVVDGGASLASVSRAT